jgi:mannose-6-phosphate isomerase-like protein (cupin superfamily)
MAEPNLVIKPSTEADKLEDGVISYAGLPPVIDSGCTAYVHYNGPTDQLSTMCTGMAVLDPGATPHAPHRHPEEETMVIAEGTGEMYVEGKTTYVKRGDIMYVGGNVEHGILNTGATPLVFYWSKWIAKGFEPAA